ncbi:MAG: hypothetical protein K9N62_05830 [Verrucomicrobia bacterium]|nr:hypothetical protein [Verrucomicrobiota bacterium]
MMERFVKVGIQRELLVDWFDHAAGIHAMGADRIEARKKCYTYLDTAPGFSSPPSLQTKAYIANAMVKTWINPDRELISIRNRALDLLTQDRNDRTAIHWALLCAAYPFWFNLASITGRLLNLQDQATQSQIVLRLKEKYGDRPTVSRRARYVIRSFIAWKTVRDTMNKGSYERANVIPIAQPEVTVLLVEAALQATPNGTCELAQLINCPAWFPFHVHPLRSDLIARLCSGIEVIGFGPDQDLLKLKTNR